MLGRAIATVAFVWLMSPHEPDLGFGCGVVATLNCPGLPGDRNAGLSGNIVERVWESSQFLHEALLSRLDAVRDDFQQNLGRPAGAILRLRTSHSA